MVDRSVTGESRNNTVVCFKQAQQWIRSARRVTVLTGAGISAESGVPTFRDSSGLWKQFHPEDLATPEAFARDPKFVWEWYDWRRSLIAKVQPNSGHCALAAFGRQSSGFTLVTQNVDGLHQQAGSVSVLEVHGSIWALRCTRCANEWVDLRPTLPLPPFGDCGALARPGVVWFGEGLPGGVWHKAERATLDCDVFLVVGTSAIVYPAAGLASLARSQGAKIVEVNVEATAISASVHCVLTGLAGEVLPKLLRAGADAE